MLAFTQDELVSSQELNKIKSGFKGFHPVYVYVHPKQLTEPEKTYSQFNQDRMILELMKADAEKSTSKILGTNKKHFFVDLAACNARFISNTYLLEQKGWEGLCIEPNPLL